MASGTSAGNARMIHTVAQKCGGIGMASFAGQQSREVIKRLAHNAQGLAIVTSRTGASYADMIKTFHQEIGCTDMAGVTGTGCVDVIDGFGLSSYPCADGVATGTIFGSVLEYGINVALFAF
jgi:hypothetical protein